MGSITIVDANGILTMAGDGADTLNASAYTAAIFSFGGAVVIGGTGADTIWGGIGAETIIGGAGSDTFVIGASPANQGVSYVITDFSASNSLLVGGDSTSSAAALQASATVSKAGVTLTLTNGTKVILANLTDASALNGRIQYNAGLPPSDPFSPVVLAGGDTLFGGPADALITTAGDTLLGGDSSAETISGNSVSGLAINSTGSFALFTAAGDTLIGAAGAETITGSAGNVTLHGTTNGDTLFGGASTHTLAGGAGNDFIVAGAGNDFLTGGGGNDYLDGGIGTDVAVYSGPRADYSVTYNADGSLTVADQRPGSPDGTDTDVNIERLQFSDGTVTIPASSSWVGPISKNRSGDFNLVSNWNNQFVPGPKTKAVIKAAGTYTVTSSQANTISGLTLGDATATLAVVGGPFAILGSSSNAGTISVADRQKLQLTGTMTNTGSIDLNGSIAGAKLIIAGTVTLNGNGAIILSDTATNAIASNGTTAHLTNNSTIEGSGAVGNSHIAFLNGATGIIDATGTSAALTIASAGSFKNNGLVEATGSAGLVIGGPLANSGTLAANGGNVDVVGAVTGAGNATIADGAVLTFGAKVAAGQTITFRLGLNGNACTGDQSEFPRHRCEFCRRRCCRSGESRVVQDLDRRHYRNRRSRHEDGRQHHQRDADGEDLAAQSVCQSVLDQCRRLSAGQRSQRRKSGHQIRARGAAFGLRGGPSVDSIT